jgi:hypothetical protein
MKEDKIQNTNNKVEIIDFAKEDRFVQNHRMHPYCNCCVQSCKPKPHPTATGWLVNICKTPACSSAACGSSNARAGPQSTTPGIRHQGRMPGL